MFYVVLCCFRCHILSVLGNGVRFWWDVDDMFVVYGEGRVGWGGVGGLITFKHTSTHTSCYATAHSSCTCTHVMLLYCTFLLHFHTHVMLRYCLFLLHFHTHVMLRYCTFVPLALGHTHTHVMLRYCTFLLHFHTHTRHATLLHVSLALAHTRHATLLHVSLALAHTRHATLLLVSLALAHTHVMLQRGTQVLDRSWMWLKKIVPHALKNRNDKVINRRLWEYIYQFVYRHNQKD